LQGKTSDKELGEDDFSDFSVHVISANKQRVEKLNKYYNTLVYS
jgi:hypothetical protein